MSTSAIRAVEGWREMSATDLHAAVTAPQAIRKPESVARVAYDALFDLLPDTIVEALHAALESVGRKAAALQLAGGGLDFGHPKTLAAIDELHSALPDVFTSEVVSTLRSIGLDTRSLWEVNGGQGEPTNEQVAALQAQCAAEDDSEAAFLAINARCNAARSAAQVALDAWQSADEIIAAAEAAWSGE